MNKPPHSDHIGDGLRQVLFISYAEKYNLSAVAFGKLYSKTGGAPVRIA